MASAQPNTRRWNRRTNASAASASRTARPATSASSDESHTSFLRLPAPAGLAEGPIPPARLSVCSGMRKILILLGAVAVFVAGCGGGGSSTPVKLSGDTTNKGTKDLTGSSIDLEQDDFYFNPTFIKGGTPGATITVHLKNDGKNPTRSRAPRSQAIKRRSNPGEPRTCRSRCRSRARPSSTAGSISRATACRAPSSSRTATPSPGGRRRLVELVELRRRLQLPELDRR